MRCLVPERDEDFGCGKTGSAVFGRFTGGGDCGYDADARGKTLIQDQDQGRLDKNIAVRKRKIRRFADFLFTSLFSAFVP